MRALSPGAVGDALRGPATAREQIGLLLERELCGIERGVEARPLCERVADARERKPSICSASRRYVAAASRVAAIAPSAAAYA